MMSLSSTLDHVVPPSTDSSSFPEEGASVAALSCKGVAPPMVNVLVTAKLAVTSISNVLDVG